MTATSWMGRNKLSLRYLDWFALLDVRARSVLPPTNAAAAPPNEFAPGSGPGRIVLQVRATSDEVLFDFLAGVNFALEPARHAPTA
jgi:hypothetical protein